MPSPFSYKNDSDEDLRASPEETAKRLHEQEQQGGFDKDFNQLTNPDHLAKDGKEGDLSGGVRDAEDRGGSWKNGISSSYAGNRAKGGKGISKANFKAVLRKRGPLAAILVLLCGGGIGAGMFFGPSLLLVQIQEAFLNRYDSQNTSMTIRSDKLLANKITGDATSGACNIVQIACRFSRPSNKLLTRLEANGVTAYDKDGNVIKKTGLFQATRPVKYSFDGKDIAAKDFYTTLRTNAKFRAAFHAAYNPRFVAFTDSVFKSIKARFGFDTSGNDTDPKKTVPENLDDVSKGANAAAGEADEGAEGVIKKLVSTEAGKAISKIAAGGKGDAVGLIAAGLCTVADVPSLLIRTVRAYQMVQLIDYSMSFLTAGSKLKAGALSPAEASGFGTLLTTTVNGKSAMDSFGIQNAMYGDTKSKSNSYKKFSPGESAYTTNGTNALGGLSQVLSSDAKKDICDVATNPATGQGINVALAANSVDTLGISLGVAAINIAAGFAIGAIINAAVVPLVTQAIKGIDFKPLLSLFVGDLTQNLAGEDVGNALTSGASNMLSQTANAGGNMPLTVSDAIAYNQTTQDVNLAYANEDRATLSPLDPTSPNTMVGSIVSGLVPYLSKMSSLSGIFTSLASIPSGSLSTLLGMATAHATSNAEDYSLCDDPSIKDAGVAAGPFCNVQYGIPPQYLNMDPQTIVDSLVNTGDVDATTGDPIDKGDTESLNRWVNTCTDGETDQLKNCEITDEKTAMYSIYTIDHRIQKTMDGEDDADDKAPSAVAGATIDQAHVYDDSTSVACAAGTDDAGTAQGYRNGTEINIRLCSIPNTTDETHANGPMKVNSRISGATLAITQALAASSANGGNPTLRVADSFRSMEEQEEAVAEYGYPRAAKPGFSNHQMGLAIDFQLGSNNGATRPGDPVYDWLVANAKNYGFGKISSEAWHWQALGADNSVAM